MERTLTRGEGLSSPFKKGKKKEGQPSSITQRGEVETRKIKEKSASSIPDREKKKSPQKKKKK